MGKETNMIKQDLTVVQQTTFQRIILPNDMELSFAKKCGHSISQLPFAVKSLKFTSKNRVLMHPSSVAAQQLGYKTICTTFSMSKFLLHIQVPEGSTYTKSELQFIDGIQQIGDTPFFCAYESSFNDSAADFQSRIEQAIKDNSGKEIVPVIEVYTQHADDKVRIMKQLQIKKCAVIYRNYKKHELAWNELLSALYESKLFSLVLGVTPRMRRTNKASILVAPLRFGANAVAHGIPWSGGKGAVMLLDNWIYTSPIQASSGSNIYNGLSRLQVQQNSQNNRFKYEFSRVDALNEANVLVQNFHMLSIQQIESLLY